MKKRLTTILLTVGLMATMAIVVPAPSASAGPGEPTVIVETQVFDSFDPCTGQPDTITETFVVTIRRNRNNIVVKTKQTAETELGYIASGSNIQVVRPGERFNSVLNVMASHPETGARFRVQGRLHMDLSDGPPEFGPPTLTCINPGR